MRGTSRAALRAAAESASRKEAGGRGRTPTTQESPNKPTASEDLDCLFGLIPLRRGGANETCPIFRKFQLFSKIRKIHSVCEMMRKTANSKIVAVQKHANFVVFEENAAAKNQ